MSRRKILWFLVCLVIIIPAIHPLFSSYVPGTADGLAHKFRLVVFEKSLIEGHLRPRWLADQALGYGSPVFLFLYPLPYYLVSAINFSGLNINLSTQIYQAFTLIFSFIAMYLLAKRLWGKKAGLVAATAYTWAPYHLLTIYLYEGWGEMTSFIFPPIILYLILKLNDQRSNVKKNQIQSTKVQMTKQIQMSKFKRITIFIFRILDFELDLEFGFCYLDFFLLVIFWFLLILSHNVSALMFSPVLLLLGLILGRGRIRPFMVILCAFVLAVVLSAFFWLPAISLNHYTAYPQLIEKEMAMRGSYFKSLETIVSVAFSTIQKGIVGYYDFTVGLPIIIVGLFGLVYSFKTIVSFFINNLPLSLDARKKVAQRKSTLVSNWFVSLTSDNAGVPSLIPPKAGQGHPTYATQQEKLHNCSKGKFLIISIFILLYGSLYLSNYSSNWLWEAFSLLRYIVYPFRFLFVATFAGSLLAGFFVRKNIIVAIFFIITAILAGWPYTKPYIDKFPFPDSYWREPQTVVYAPRTKKSMATTEFLPKWIDPEFLVEAEKQYLEKGKLPEKFVLPEGTGEISRSKIGVEEIEVSLKLKKSTDVTVNTFYFPNWQAFLDGKNTIIEKDRAGRMVVSVPQGEHELKFVFGTTEVEKTGKLISIVGLAIVVGMIILSRKKRQTEKN